ncbi:MAG: helix-turn-helix domain-containing protein [Rickettsiaceae bacterium]
MFNLDNISYIEDSHGKKAVILSLESYEQMREQIEELQDIKSYIDRKESNEETLPFELVQELIEGKESRVKIMRKYSGLSIADLAKKIEITDGYLSQIENNKRKGTIEIYKKLAKALSIDIDLIV